MTVRYCGGTVPAPAASEVRGPSALSVGADALPRAFGVETPLAVPAAFSGVETPLAVPAAACTGAEEHSLRGLVEALPGQVFTQVDQFAIHSALGQCVDALVAINGYLERSAPWLRAKAGDQERVATILYTAGEALRLVSILLAPVLPERTAELWRRLGWQPPEKLAEGLRWGGWQPGSPVTSGEPLFPRIEAVH
jgi:methionyl-tRNA synthetase